MVLRNTKKNNNGNLLQQFSKFRQDLLASGRDPKQILNELIASGKVSNQDLQRVIKQAKDSHLM